MLHTYLPHHINELVSKIVIVQQWLYFTGYQDVQNCSSVNGVTVT